MSWPAPKWVVQASSLEEPSAPGGSAKLEGCDMYDNAASDVRCAFEHRPVTMLSPSWRYRTLTKNRSPEV